MKLFTIGIRIDIINIDRYVFVLFFKLFNLIIAYRKVYIVPFNKLVINILFLMIHITGMVFFGIARKNHIEQNI